MIQLNSILPNPNNPRLIKDERFKKLCDNIKRYPKFLAKRPIVIDSFQNPVILGGNMRYRALSELGYREIPEEWVKEATGFTDEEKRAFIIIDNLEYGEEDWEKLANEWEENELKDWGLELPFNFKGEAEEDDYVIPDEIETDIITGDLFEIGQHRLLCGDSTKADDVEKVMGGQKADMVFTDPPYGMCLDTDFSDMDSKFKGSKGGNKYEQVKGDNADFKSELITTIFENFGYCKEIFLWGADYYADLLQDKNNGSWVVWDKRLDESADKMYGSCFELCWSKAKHKRMIARIKWAGIFGMEKEHGKKRMHPTQKPVLLVTWFFDYYSLKDKKTVYDPFLGSGTTMVAAHQLNRKCIGIEISPQYCQIIVDRMLNLDPTLEVKRNGKLYKKQDSNTVENQLTNGKQRKPKKKSALQKG